MTEQLLRRQRRRESVIQLGFTLFSLFLIYIIIVLNWNTAMVPLITAEIVFAWWAYLGNYKSHYFRAVVVTTMACTSVFFYGVHAADFLAIIPTLCVSLVLFSLYQIQPVLDIVNLCHILLFIYHLAVGKTFAALFRSEDEMMLPRLSLQLLSFVIFTLLEYYIIRRRREEDEDLAASQAEIERVKKIKDDFVANTSHELRTPIHTISGMSEILLQEDLPDRVHHEVLDIQMTGIELQTLVSDIMDYAALESGTLQLTPRAYNITSTLNDIMNMTVFLNRDKGLELIFDCDPAIPCLLYGDEQQLRRVINNLIGNAVKFTTEGGVVVSVTYRSEDYGANLIVKVRDTGIGLSAEEQERIFQGFYQTDASRTRAVEGMGLGLTISSAIVRAMGGFMTVRSEKGKGSEFSFSVPQKVMDERPCIALTHPNLINAIWYFDEQKADSAIRDDYIAHIRNTAEYLGIVMLRSATLPELKRRVRTGQFTHLLIGMEEYRDDPMYFDDLSIQMPVILLAEREQSIPTANRIHILYKPYNAMTMAEMFNGGEITRTPRKIQEERRFVAPSAKVLVVDDNLMNLKVVEGLLRRYRIRITAASSGEEALSLIESRDYDFVFMDHMMPGMDGIECFHRIRSKQGSSYYSKVPIIALTANAISGSREMFLEEGFNDFVAKPIDNAVFDQVLRKFIPAEKQILFSEAGRNEAAAAKGAESGGDVFAGMEGIDMETALAYCGGDIEDYTELARVYLSTGEKYRGQLEEAFDAKDLKAYAALAHTIKSTSKTLGAMKLSELAFKEEQAAKENDENTVKQYHPSFTSEYARVLDTLRNNPVIGAEDEDVYDDTHIPLMEKEWDELKNALLQRLKTYEADQALSLIEDNRSRSLGGVPFKDALKDVIKKINEFEFDEAARVLDRTGGDAF